MMMVMTKADPQVPLSSRVAPVSFSKNHTTNQIIYVKVVAIIINVKSHHTKFIISVNVIINKTIIWQL